MMKSKRQAQRSFGMRLRSSEGFSLAEIIIVLSVLAILTGVAIVRFSGTRDQAVQAAGERIITDIAYAQEMARTSNRGTEIRFYAGGGGGGGHGHHGWCFVATVCYGENSREVRALRGFRDEILSKSMPGRAFIDWYYREGPDLAKWIDDRELMKKTVRIALLPLALLSAPFAEDVYALGGGGGGGGGGGHGGGGGEPNSYSIKYQDGAWIQNPQGGGDFNVQLDDQVSITSSNQSVEFDGSGRAEVPGYTWSSSQTSMVIVTLNSELNIRIARHTGKTWIE